ncbi:MAG: polysulfide reductase NrfD [Gammaproteobacteria bacterium]|nr:MAG: polysulfide reductase NrfD [Gammaproteobacteria bacterium]
MEQELIWGLPVVGYLFLAGMGAGALITSASMLLRSHGRSAFYRLARYGAIISLPLVGIGVFLLVFELGSFQAGHWFRWINLYKTINLSPMSIGSWLLLLYFFATAPYALTFILPGNGLNDKWKIWRDRLAYVSIALGISVAVYTGVLLGAMPARPLWNSPILAMLFLVSSISTGIAVVLFTDWLVKLLNWDWPARYFNWQNDKNEGYSDATYILAVTDTLLIGLELMVVFLFFMYAHLTVGHVEEAIKVFQLGGELAGPFWIGVVVIGLLIPGLIELIKVFPALIGNGQYVHGGITMLLVPILVITGGFLLRYVIVVGGQIARLAGI